MTAKATRRNDPCPCGSGKKYKKCCLAKESPGPTATTTPPLLPPSPPGILYEDDIDKLSNSALDAIDDQQYDQAERLCEQLLREYPDLIDGHDRFAMLREAQQRFPEAAEHYARALDIIKRHPHDYDPELAADFEQRRQNALAESAPRP